MAGYWGRRSLAIPLTGKELMLQNGRPFIILRLAAKAVDLVFIKHKQATGWGKFTRLIIARVTAGKAATIDPVAAVEPCVIQKSRGAKQVCRVTALLTALPGKITCVRAKIVAFSNVIEFLRLHVDELVVARQNIRQADGHL